MAHGRLVIRIVVLYRGLPYGCKRYSFEHRGGSKRVPIDGEWHNPGIRRCYGKVRFKRIETATEVAARMSLKTGEVLTLTFADGETRAVSGAKPGKKKQGADQGSLF